MTDLQSVRDEIMRVSVRVAQLLDLRHQLATKAAQYKQAMGLPAVDRERERQLITEVIQRNPGSCLSAQALERIMSTIIEQTKSELGLPLTEPLQVGPVGGERTRITVRGNSLSGIIAGPCSVESVQQVDAAARAVYEAGLRWFRAGLWKPRTHPGSFQGLGESGLSILRDIKKQFEFIVVSEILDPRHFDVIDDVVDVVQIGSRNMHNYQLLIEAGRFGRPVILKRGYGATIQEWILAAEYIARQGNDMIILCERGIRTFEDKTRNTLDLSSVPELAVDIQRHLDYELVQAGAPGAGYRARKFLRRHRGIVTTVAAVLVALTVGLVFASVQYVSAEKQRILSNERYEEIIRLADIKRLADAQAKATTLWPVPQHIGRMKAWLETARQLCERLPLHRADLLSLRAQVTIEDSDEMRNHQITALQWRHDTLAELVANLEKFADRDDKAGTLARVEQFLARARLIAREYRDTWARAKAAIAASEIYAGLEVEPHLDLLPLGSCFQSGLWEFWHIPSGERPQGIPGHEAVSRWRINEQTGLVLVLVPGGRFRMGAQKDDPRAPNYDSGALNDEAISPEVELSPFFMSKYEMTQGQWVRLSGSNSSYFKGDLRLPVGSLSWFDCLGTLAAANLLIPTEAQWEYAARAGTETPWWTGAEPASTKRAGVINSVLPEPVGGYEPNGFGLHDTIGNNWEWCRDWFGNYRDTTLSADGLRKVDAEDSGVERRGRVYKRIKVRRGGSWYNPTDFARSAYREKTAPQDAKSDFGIRPSRALRP